MFSLITQIKASLIVACNDQRNNNRSLMIIYKNTLCLDPNKKNHFICYCGCVLFTALTDGRDSFLFQQEVLFFLKTPVAMTSSLFDSSELQLFVPLLPAPPSALTLQSFALITPSPLIFCFINTDQPLCAASKQPTPPPPPSSSSLSLNQGATLSYCCV